MEHKKQHRSPPCTFFLVHPYKGQSSWLLIPQFVMPGFEHYINEFTWYAFLCVPGFFLSIVCVDILFPEWQSKVFWKSTPHKQQEQWKTKTVQINNFRTLEIDWRLETIWGIFLLKINSGILASTERLMAFKLALITFPSPQVHCSLKNQQPHNYGSCEKSTA